MDLLIRHIEYLLCDNDNVAVPGLGVFIAIPTAAYYDPVTAIITPPGRRFALVSGPVQENDILVKSVSRAMGVSASQATTLVAGGVQAILDALQEGQSVTIGTLGTLIAGNDNTAVFSPSDRDTVSAMAGWLSPVSAPAAARSASYAPPVAAAVPPGRSRWVTALRYTSGTAAAVFLALVLSTPVSAPDNGRQATTALPAVTYTHAAPSPQQRPLTIALPAGTAMAPVDTAARTAWRQQLQDTAATAAQTDTAQPAATTHPYVVVVASLKTRTEANDFIKAQRRRNIALQYGVLAKNDHYRVYAATAPTKEQALREARTPAIADNYNGAWVTRR